MSVEWIEYNGTPILYADFRWAETTSEMLRTLETQVEEMEMAGGKVRLLADFRNTCIDDIFLEQAAQYSKEELGSKTEKSAILDVFGMKRSLLQGLEVFTGGDIESFENEDEAIDYLAT